MSGAVLVFRLTVAVAVMVSTAAFADQAPGTTPPKDGGRPATATPSSPGPADGSAVVPILMTPGDTTAISVAIAKAFVRPMMKVPDGEATPPFSWGRYDVLGDGYGEMVLAFRSPTQCSDAGCPILVMRHKPDGSWTPIMAAVATSIAARRKGKVADLVVAGAPGQKTTWVWDGAKQGMVASKD